VSIGEGLVDLGHILSLTGQFRRGFDMAHEGISLLRENAVDPNERAFLARGLKKYAPTARRAFRYSAAISADAERSTIVDETEALDQRFIT